MLINLSYPGKEGLLQGLLMVLEQVMRQLVMKDYIDISTLNVLIL